MKISGAVNLKIVLLSLQRFIRLRFWLYLKTWELAKIRKNEDIFKLRQLAAAEIKHARRRCGFWDCPKWCEPTGLPADPTQFPFATPHKEEMTYLKYPKFLFLFFNFLYCFVTIIHDQNSFVWEFFIKTLPEFHLKIALSPNWKNFWTISFLSTTVKLTTLLNITAFKCNIR